MASTSSFATSSMAHSANKSSTNFHSNFAEQKPSQDSRLSIEYDHETYLQLIAGDRAAEKTANQIYLEVCPRSISFFRATYMVYDIYICVCTSKPYPLQPLFEDLQTMDLHVIKVNIIIFTYFNFIQSHMFSVYSSYLHFNFKICHLPISISWEPTRNEPDNSNFVHKIPPYPALRVILAQRISNVHKATMRTTSTAGMPGKPRNDHESKLS
jgi:hypothetical protein